MKSLYCWLGLHCWEYLDDGIEFYYRRCIRCNRKEKKTFFLGPWNEIHKWNKEAE